MPMTSKMNQLAYIAPLICLVVSGLIAIAVLFKQVYWDDDVVVEANNRPHEGVQIGEAQTERLVADNRSPIETTPLLNVG